MITTTPRLTILIVAMTVLGTGGPIAAFAQAANVQQIGDLTNAAAVSAGENSQVNAAETTQITTNNVTINNEAESGGAVAISIAEASTSGDAVAGQILSDVEIDNDATQTSTTIQTNTISDGDAVTVTQTNGAVQTQEGAIAVDIAAEDLTGEELVALLEGILGGGDGEECPTCG